MDTASFEQVEEYLNTRVYGPDSGIYDIFELPHHFQSHSCVVMKLAFPGNHLLDSPCLGLSMLLVLLCCGSKL
mgnify:CR=1 FL=1